MEALRPYCHICTFSSWKFAFKAFSLRDKPSRWDERLRWKQASHSTSSPSRARKKEKKKHGKPKKRSRQMEDKASEGERHGLAREWKKEWKWGWERGAERGWGMCGTVSVYIELSVHEFTVSSDYLWRISLFLLLLAPCTTSSLDTLHKYPDFCVICQYRRTCTLKETGSLCVISDWTRRSHFSTDLLHFLELLSTESLENVCTC